MKFTVGMFDPAKVEVTNRQQNVEFKLLSGFASEEEVRKSVGNSFRDTYDYSYTGFYMDRNKAIERMESKLKDLESEIETLKFAIKVTKKKNWVKVEG